MLREQQLRFLEWKENPVTSEFLNLIRNRIEEAKNHLTPSTNTHEYDLFVKGMIHAYQEVVDVKLDILLEEIDKDE